MEPNIPKPCNKKYALELKHVFRFFFIDSSEFVSWFKADQAEVYYRRSCKPLQQIPKL